MMCAAMVRPRPQASELVVKKGSKTLPTCSEQIPNPVSLTSSLSIFVSARAPIESMPPLGMAHTALRKMLSRAWRTKSGLTRTGGSFASANTDTDILAESISGSIISRVWSTRSVRLTISLLAESGLEKSRTLFSTFSIFSVSLTMILRYSSSAWLASAFRSSERANPPITVMGLRSSCASCEVICPRMDSLSALNNLRLPSAILLLASASRPTFSSSS